MVRVKRSPELQELTGALHRAAFLIGFTEFNRQSAGSQEPYPDELREVANKVRQTTLALMHQLSGRRARAMAAKIEDVVSEALREIARLGITGGLIVEWDIDSAAAAYYQWVEETLDSN